MIRNPAAYRYAAGFYFFVSLMRLIDRMVYIHGLASIQKSKKSMHKDLLKSKSNFIFASAIAKVAQLVEHNLAKVRVAGSSPVFRSLF